MESFLQTPRVALAEVELRAFMEGSCSLHLQLALLLQVADSHLQDVGFLQLGVGLVPLKLLLQEQFQLLDAAVNPVTTHFLHHRLPQFVFLLWCQQVVGLHENSAGSHLSWGRKEGLRVEVREKRVAGSCLCPLFILYNLTKSLWVSGLVEFPTLHSQSGR